MRWTGLVLISWLVASACGGGGTQNPVGPDSVRIPVLLSPPDGALLDNGCSDKSNLLVWEFTWSAASGATAYHLYVKNRSVTLPVIDVENLAQTSYQSSDFSYVLDEYTQGWEWRVRAYVGGTFRDWSTTRTFSVEPLDTDCPK